MQEKDKQIEEFYELLTRDCETSCCECKFDRLDLCLPHRKAEALYNAGYRKASEVAEEIFAEIETSLHYKLINGEIHLIIREADYNEYKKKYTQEK